MKGDYKSPISTVRDARPHRHGRALSLRSRTARVQNSMAVFQLNLSNNISFCTPAAQEYPEEPVEADRLKTLSFFYTKKQI